MSENFERCSKCKTVLKIEEHGFGGPGGKDSEPIFCPKCNNLLGESRTSGWWHVVPANQEEVKDFEAKENTPPWE
ncbi:hypothetical protein [Pseudodesulfovibrio senegalensis]|uniref:Uncharacterized protein n=1 Tax=Pseudodesulfovibrio senegalensis TaxID=1721087 RepID=A0A6N6N1C8_9BACT|nr:hypothetical protein [Pseudodesulfovibrio senegalensis]KAB1437316.1 hypothetical protein F8A88_15430 [Pseudodesulfovibrio senegalensis]